MWGTGGARVRIGAATRPGPNTGPNTGARLAPRARSRGACLPLQLRRITRCTDVSGGGFSRPGQQGGDGQAGRGGGGCGGCGYRPGIGTGPRPGSPTPIKTAGTPSTAAAFGLGQTLRGAAVHGGLGAPAAPLGPGVSWRGPPKGHPSPGVVGVRAVRPPGPDAGANLERGVAGCGGPGELQC